MNEIHEKNMIAKIFWIKNGDKSLKETSFFQELDDFQLFFSGFFFIVDFYFIFHDYSEGSEGG